MKKLFKSLPFLKKLKKLDYLVILMLFAIFSSLIISRLLRKQEWVTVGLHISSDEWWWNSQNPEYWIVEDLEKGLISKNTFGEEIAEIVEVIDFEYGNGKRTVFLEMRLKANFDKKRGLYTYNSRPLEIGGNLNLTFEKQNVRGLIAYLGDDRLGEEELWANVTVKYSRIEKELADSIIDNPIMTDSQGRILVEASDVRKQIYSNNVFSDIRGKNIRAYDNDYMDIFMDLKIKVYKSGNKHYFLNGTNIVNGSEIWFHFNDHFLSQGTIIDFKIQ